ncbi:MAG: penicillin-binding protein activator [Deltaproteobacteria bacterium]|jgi:hypothetical protein|nr:penicillin-binding protein activator [Deltaproteobacteria bacterium]
MSEHTKRAPRRALRVIFILGALLLSIFLLGSCAGLPGGFPGSHTGERTTPKSQSGQVNLSAAQQAYDTGNLQQAESIASALVAQTGPDSPIGVSEQSAAWRIIALTSLAGNRPQYALSALEQWRSLNPRTAAQEEWLQLWRRALDELPYHEAVQAAETAAASQSSPWQQVMEAKLYILENHLRAGVLSGLPEEFERLYQSTGDPATRRKLEQRLFSRLHGSNQAVMQQLCALVNERNEKYYPYALFRLEEARRLFLDPTTQDLAREIVNFMTEDSRLADKNLLRTWTDPDLSSLGEFAAGTSGARAGEIHLALVLPMSGQYGNLSDKIVRGAEIACNGFRRNGQDVRLRLIDSDQPGWLQELAALPPEVQIVGGPLRASDYAAIKAANQGTHEAASGIINWIASGGADAQPDQLGSRKFFTFLRALEPGEEGRLAWRFFSSNEDQVEAVLLFAKNLGINDYAVMTPEESYGQRMSALFRSEVTGLSGADGLDGVLVKEQLYPANEHQAWNKLVANFLGTDKEAETAPQTQFRALFLPDSWQNATIMMPHFLYYRENRLLFMGTMLWEQGISLQQRADSGSYRLVVFPGAWDPNTLSPSGLILRTALANSGTETPDFWFSLGYDFVTMAASLPASAHSAQSTPYDLNLALASLPPLPWSGAPLSWDNAGLAKQSLFVFTPADNGFILADPARFRVYYQRAWRE